MFLKKKIIIKLQKFVWDNRIWNVSKRYFVDLYGMVESGMFLKQYFDYSVTNSNNSFIFGRHVKVSFVVIMGT